MNCYAFYKVSAISCPGFGPYDGPGGHRRAWGPGTVGHPSLVKAALLALAVAGLSGCNAPGLVRADLSERSTALQEAFRASGLELVQRLKGLLGGSDPDTALDIQTAITLETVRQPPRSVAERRRFQAEAARLDNLLAAGGGAGAPRDSAILAYLADLAGGRSSSQSFLEQGTARQVVALCGPSHALLAPDARVFDEGEENAFLRQACFSWLLGDAAKARGLFYRAKARSGDRTVQAADNPFDLFVQRLRERTGHDLAAHRTRLVGPTPLAGSGTLVGRSPMDFARDGERAAASEAGTP